MVRHIHHRVMTEKIDNVLVVLADPRDPTVSAAADVVFVCDVIHHVEGREAWLRTTFSEMKPGAKLVVIEARTAAARGSARGGKDPEGEAHGDAP